MRRVLVTGGLGYVGGRVSAHLAHELGPDHVRVGARDSSRRPAWATGIEIVGADVRDGEALRAAMRDVDTVVHLAAVDENMCRDDPDLALKVNGRGTRLAVEAAVAEGVRRFCYVSTFHVYGPSAASPITELTSPRPVHPYAITHHVGEDFVWQAAHDSGIEAVIARLSNGFGYPMDDYVHRWSLVFNDLCLQAVSSGRLVLQTPGLQERDFIPLEDVARAIAHLIALPAGALGDGLFNVGSGRSLSVRGVADLVAERFRVRRGGQVAIDAPDPPAGAEPPPVRFDVGKLLATGFSPGADWDREVDGTFDVAERVAARTAGR